MNDLAIPDVLECKRVHRGYPTEKPVSLIEILIKQSSSEGDMIVDPFFGSGSTLVAATNLGRIAVGCDISNAAHKYIQGRITQNLAEPACLDN